MWAVVLDAGPESPEKLAFRVVQKAQSSKMQYRSISAHIDHTSVCPMQDRFEQFLVGASEGAF